MIIRHENIRCALLAWAAESSQEFVASAIAAAYLDLGGNELPLIRITDPVSQRHESWRTHNDHTLFVVVKWLRMSSSTQTTIAVITDR